MLVSLGGAVSPGHYECRRATGWRMCSVPQAAAPRDRCSARRRVCRAWLTANRWACDLDRQGWPRSAGSPDAPRWSSCRPRRAGCWTAAVMRWLAPTRRPDNGPCVHGRHRRCDRGTRLGRVRAMFRPADALGGRCGGPGSLPLPGRSGPVLRSALKAFGTDAHAHEPAGARRISR
jgi:hypothetical protein